MYKLFKYMKRVRETISPRLCLPGLGVSNRNRVLERYLFIKLFGEFPEATRNSRTLVDP